MFTYLVKKLVDWLEWSQQCRCVDYLSRASDLADLERRMRIVEEERT